MKYGDFIMYDITSNDDINYFEMEVSASGYAVLDSS